MVAETLYERLKTKPKELAVEQLICMINFPLKDARTSYLYYWRRDPLIVTSTFELLEQLNERDYTVERMMAHLAAAVVAGIPHTHVGLGRPIVPSLQREAGYSIDRRAAHVLCELP